MIKSFLIVVALLLGSCDDANDSGNRATSGTTPRAAPSTSSTTSPALEPADTGARASGGVFEAPSTQPAPR